MDYEAGSVERAEDIGKGEEGVVRRWLLELKLADKREQEWRKKAGKVWDRYRQKDAKRHSFNILWSNTETLRPAVYNSLPSPDVRRRFKDADPLGKAAAETLSRSLEYQLDTTPFDSQIKATVLDMLLPGRGVARVRYVPSLRQVGVTAETHEEEAEAHEPGGEALEGATEELDWEQATVEHVQWDDFRMSEGKEWSEVCWIAFRHRLSRDELVEKFGDLGELVELDATDDEDIKAEHDAGVAEMFKTAEVWEIWDKDERKVHFISKGYRNAPLDSLNDPLNLTDFWPIPAPLYAVEDSSTQVPVPLFELYREQAAELDEVTRRINLLIKGLKLRGIYDSTLSELSELMRGEDNDLIPASNVSALLERGGLEKAIWFMPIEMAARVLQILYQQREATKQTVYEITGISDIMRGSTNAQETASAQQIKANWGSNRLKRLQADVARFIRDLIRLQAEIIGERFQVETLQTMTGLKFPTMAEKQQAMLQWQQQAMMAQQAGQQPPPQPQLPPSWEEIVEVLRNDKLRTFKVDVETDSTVAASQESDMQSLRDLLGGLAQIMKEYVPAVQMGALPMEAMKEILLTVTRRARMGNAVEDAIDAMKQPPPPPPQQAPQDNSVQVEQVRQQGAQTVKQAELRHAAQIEQFKQQAETERERMRVDAESDYRWRIEQLKAETQIIVATIAAQQKAHADAEREASAAMAESEAEAGEQESVNEDRAISDARHTELQQTIATALQGFQAAVERLSAPRQIVRGPDGRVMGVQ